MNLRLSHLRLELAEFVLRADFAVQSARTAIFGPSGAGKTTLLEIIAGLRTAKSGSVRLEDTVFDDASRGFHLPIRLRKIGYVPQDDTLFPHFSVRRNLLYGHDENGNGAVSLDHVTEFLEIKPLLDRDVRQISRGEKQRIAIARTLLSAPRLLLLDEPLTALDVKLKEAILDRLLSLYSEFGVPMLYVTHDPAEAIALCDEVILLENGEVTGRGDPRNLLAHSHLSS